MQISTEITYIWTTFHMKRVLIIHVKLSTANYTATITVPASVSFTGGLCHILLEVHHLTDSHPKFTLTIPQRTVTVMVLKITTSPSPTLTPLSSEEWKVFKHYTTKPPAFYCLRRQQHCTWFLSHPQYFPISNIRLSLPIFLPRPSSYTLPSQTFTNFQRCFPFKLNTHESKQYLHTASSLCCFSWLLPCIIGKPLNMFFNQFFQRP